MDNSLPAAGYLKVTLPSGVFSSGPSSCHAWEVTTTLDAPASLSSSWNLGTYALGYCSFTTALSAGTTYGVRLTGGVPCAVGVFAPVVLSTTLTDSAVATIVGPL